MFKCVSNHLLLKCSPKFCCYCPPPPQTFLFRPQLLTQPSDAISQVPSVAIGQVLTRLSDAIALKCLPSHLWLLLKYLLTWPSVAIAQVFSQPFVAIANVITRPSVAIAQ